MIVRLTEAAVHQYESLPPSLQRRAARQFTYLATNLRHPSLNAKKYDEARDIWQGRVTRDYRFYFTIDGGTYTVLAITKHPK
jgi:mRNA-degrading endonuclease RelE of RelBE toxin-antitoxin system